MQYQAVYCQYSPLFQSNFDTCRPTTSGLLGLQNSLRRKDILPGARYCIHWMTYHCSVHEQPIAIFSELFWLPFVQHGKRSTFLGHM